MLFPLYVLLMVFGRFGAVTGFDYDIEGNLYVVDRDLSMLVKYSPDGDSLGAISGRGSGPLQFEEPVAVFARRGTDIYVADRYNHRIQRFDRNLDLVATIFTRDDGDERRRFGYPLDVAVTRQGDIVVVDGENRRVLRIDALGRSFTSIGVGSGSGRLSNPTQVEIDSRDNIYVLDGRRVAWFDPFGSYVQDIPLPLGSPHAFSIDRDTLVAVDSSRVILFDLQSRTPAGGGETSTRPVAVRLVAGRIVAAEPTRIAVYARHDDMPPFADP